MAVGAQVGRSRCLADSIELQSKASQPLARYFRALSRLKRLDARRFIVDGEIVIPVEGKLSFDELLLRTHPAESRIGKLASEHPAVFIVFDLLAGERGASVIEKDPRARRPRLKTFPEKFFLNREQVRLSPATRELEIARKRLRTMRGGSTESSPRISTRPTKPASAAAC